MRLCTPDQAGAADATNRQEQALHTRRSFCTCISSPSVLFIFLLSSSLSARCCCTWVWSPSSFKLATCRSLCKACMLSLEGTACHGQSSEALLDPFKPLKYGKKRSSALAHLVSLNLLLSCGQSSCLEAHLALHCHKLCLGLHVSLPYSEYGTSRTCSAV